MIAPITTIGYSSLLKQLNWREQLERLRLKTQLQTARALGDLSENAEYQATKDESKRNENEINKIKAMLTTTETTPLKGKKRRVQFNSIIVLKSCKSNEYKTYYITGEKEIARNKNSISIASITAQSLINKKEGDVVVTPAHTTPYKIVYIKTW
ncbi:GreA/GreB family elongation factor [Candidatus Hodgkinia cicadicola]